MTTFTRRGALVSTAALVALAACGNGIGSRGSEVIDRRVQASLEFLESTYPGTLDLRQRAAGMLVMPLVTEAGFGVGGAYGRGALLIDGAVVDYYSATSASFGLQIGAQQYAHVLYFMTPEALASFRASPGWAAGADIEYTVSDDAMNIGADTTTVLDPVVAVVFGQAGLLAGATVEGTKYTRIIP